MAKILFLQRDAYEQFGIMYLSAFISQKGHKAEVLIEAEERKFYKKIAAIKPDIIAFSIMSGNQSWVANTAKRLKHKYNCPIIAGGPHCTFFPEFIYEEGIDAICRGDGEDSLAGYLDAVEKKAETTQIKGWWVKTAEGIVKNDIYPLRKDLDTLPYPDRNIYRERYPSLYRSNCCEVFVARGCPYTCAFCYNQILKQMYFTKGHFLRRHSVQRVIDEIKSYRQNHGRKVKWVAFVDDLFIMDKRWLDCFLIKYKQEIDLPFSCSLRANIVDEKLVSKLSDAGCKVCSFGIESGNAELRNKMLNKNISDQQIILTGKLLKKYKIRFSTFNMFNIPEETFEKAQETISINLKIRPGNYPWSGLLQPYRGTRIYDHAVQLGMIPDGEIGCNLYTSVTLKQEDSELLASLNAYFYWLVRYPFTRPVIMFLIRHPVAAFSRISMLSSSFHRSVSLVVPFEGFKAVLTVLKDGLKRLKSYSFS